MSENVKKMRKPSATVAVIKGFFGFIGRTLATVIMVGIITGCIVACILTAYILNYITAEEDINLDSITMGYTSIMYAIDPETGDYKELQQLYVPNGNRILVDYEDISPYVSEALIAIEDKRFMEHDGVDWKRTAGAFVNMFVPIYPTKQGGSTITQQLVKNVTQDDDFRVDRKVREIFRALNLAQNYSKEQILEAYLNVVTFGNGTNGIESAANTYFGKHASELDLAESAAVVGITQKPTAYNPFLNPERNKERQEHVLSEMLKQEKISQQEYDDAVAQKLDFKKMENQQTVEHTQTFFEDHVINAVIDDLMAQKGYTKTEATRLIYEAGYRIYTTVDVKMQEYLQNFYLDVANFPAVRNKEYPQSSCVITDPNGKILAMVGKIGEKEGARTFNRATMALRHPGSSIKPLAAYASSFEYDRITWSTLIDDHPINIAGKDQPEKWWPTNYYGQYTGMMTVDTAIQRSANTVAVRLVQALDPRKVFDFLRDDLNFYSLVEREVDNGRTLSDIGLAPMSLGALTHGVTGLEMAGGYQIFINGGTFTKPYAYTKVTDSNGRTILEADTTARRVISEETSVIMNKLLQRVVSGPSGTGKPANLGIMPTAGKTGTSDKDVDQWFMGITPYYVCQVWLGYDEPNVTEVNPNTGKRETKVNTIGYSGLGYPPPILWKSIMLPLQEGLETKAFLESDEVVSKQYCTISGDLAGPQCTSVATGWYKKSRPPRVCAGHFVPDAEDVPLPDDFYNPDSDTLITSDSPTDVAAGDDGALKKVYG